MWTVMTRPRLSRCGRVDGVRFNFHTVQYIETGKSFCASPGTGMGTGANLNAAPAEASRPTSITKSLAGWPSFFSWKHSTCALSVLPGTDMVWKQPAWPCKVCDTDLSREYNCIAPLMTPAPP